MVNQALTFNTTDMHIQGTCDLFTTKPIGADRKLYKTLNKLYNPTNEHDVDMDNNDSSNAKTERQDSNSSVHTNSNSIDCELNEQFVQLKKRSFSYSYSNSSPLQQKLQTEHKSRSKSFTSPPPPGAIALPNSVGNDSPFGPLSQPSSRKLFGYLIAILNSTYPDHDFSTIEPSHFSLLGSSSDLMSKVNNFLISLGKSTGLTWVWETINRHIELDNSICFQFEPQESFLDDFPGVIWCNMYFMFNKKKKRVAFLYFLATANDSNNTSVTQLRRNSKIGTLDEERGNTTADAEEYDLRNDPQGEPIYEDVFDDEEEVVEEEDEEEEEEEDQEAVEQDDDEDFVMDGDLANENQDDEDLP